MLNPTQKQEIIHYLKTKQNPALAIFELLKNTEISFSKLAEEHLAEMKQQFIAELREILNKNIEALKGEKGDDGENYVLTAEDKKEIVGKIEVPIVEKVIERTEVIKEQPIITEITKITNEIKEVAKTDTGEKIVDKINELPLKPEFQIDASHIKNFPQPETVLGGRGKQTVGAGGSEIKDYDLSPYLDGVTKVFTVPSNKRFISLIGTQFPIVYRKTTDYTGSGTPTLTLTDAVSAPSGGQTLILTYAEL